MSRFGIVNMPKVFPAQTRVLKHHSEKQGPFLDTMVEEPYGGRLYISYKEMVLFVKEFLTEVDTETFLSDIGVESSSAKTIKEIDASVSLIHEIEARIKNAIAESVSTLDVSVNVVFDSDDRPDSDEVPKDSSGESEGNSSTKSGSSGVSKTTDTDIGLEELGISLRDK